MVRKQLKTDNGIGPSFGDDTLSDGTLLLISF